MNLLNDQKRLKLNIVDYDLNSVWSSHPLIDNLRPRIKKYFPTGLYDPQDLEHQVLFRLTTFDPGKITDDVIKEVVSEQYLVLRARLSKCNIDLEHLFRGLSGKYHDLNVNNRLTLCWDESNILAKNDHMSFAVEFKQIQNQDIISLFTNELHYIHHERPRGDTFGLFFCGESIPWAIETTEPSVLAKKYKREALLANGIDPNKAVELTRFYSLPGAPINAISIMDGLVSEYYRQKGIEALFTTTMPMYSKTKSSTIAGGINIPLLVKDLRHTFIPEIIAGKRCYRHVTTIAKDYRGEVLNTHPNFPTMFVVEVFKRISQPSIPPLPILANSSKVIYVKKRDVKLEKEVKFRVTDVSSILVGVRKLARFDRCVYIRDTIYGSKTKKRKIRMRVEDNFESMSVELIYKHKVDTGDGIKSEIEETLYTGNDLTAARFALKKEGDFVEENSYEKIRSRFLTKDVEIDLDVYPYGVWFEIEGDIDDIWKIAAILGFSKTDAVTANADELYLEWQKKHHLPEMWDVRFGLTGER